MRTKLAVTIDHQEMVTVPLLGDGTRLIPGETVRLIEVQAVVPTEWMAAELLRAMSDALGSHLEAEESRRQEILRSEQ